MVDRPLIREVVPCRQNRNCLTVTEMWPWAPEEGSHQLTGGITVGRNMTSTLTSTCLNTKTWQYFCVSLVRFNNIFLNDTFYNVHIKTES
jgi:hypothetical protein